MIYYGFDEVLYGWPRYFDLCNAFEVRWPADIADAPSIATLNKWRVESPRGFAWVCHTTPSFVDALVEAYERGAGLSDAARAGWEETIERAHALAARAILLETPPGFPPSDASRALIRELGDDLAANDKRLLFWEPSGLWTAEDVDDVTRDHGVIPVVDPFAFEADGRPLPRRNDICFRITERAAARRQFDEWEMEKLIDWGSGFDRAFILLAGRFKVPHAKELAMALRDDVDE